jgi:hypothetical protein
MSQCQQQHLLSLLQPKEILAESVAPPPPPTIQNKKCRIYSTIYSYQGMNSMLKLYVFAHIFYCSRTEAEFLDVTGSEV